jgi:ribosomal protein S18 acetylase RimI-like enzyme
MKPRPTLRPARRDELPGICNSLSAIEPWLRIGIPSSELLTAFTGDHLRQTWVAEAGDEIAGVVAYRTQKADAVLESLGATELLHGYSGNEGISNAGYIHALAVLPGFEGIGLGKALLDHADNAVGKVSDTILLFVSEFNSHARSFYERNGYCFIGALENCLRPGNTEHLMVKSLVG